MRSNKEVVFSAITLFVFGLALTGCPKAKGPAPIVEVEPVEAPVVAVPEPVIPSVDLGTTWGMASEFIDAVTFDYMSADLKAEARASLKMNAGVLKTIQKSVPSLKIRIEGHCDDRGTLEYNMALGQRRAKAVRDYYATLGVAKTALDTISYGEERPVCLDASEGCWARNRRGETTLKAASPINVPLPN